ncbi:GGDEF domain-containing protein [Pilimelia columellifera]|uniref:GGDEF domain-containing protein n=1 Tax=Pilimelia columellifera subsp. columellifera TaxID=706583 RepID=A0ABN3NI43_9ACTN
MLAVQLILTATAGVLTGLALALIPINTLRRRLREVTHQARHDELTGLPNRRHLMTHLRQAVSAGEQVAVAVLDLDGFKTINDRYGHGAGDDILTETARRLNTTAGVRLAARLAGDEFALVIDQSSVEQVQAVVVDAANRVLAKPVFLGPRNGWISVPGMSAGVTAADPAATHRLLLHRADLAMFTAKTQGCGLAWHDAAAETGAGAVPERPDVRQRDRRTSSAAPPAR